MRGAFAGIAGRFRALGKDKRGVTIIEFALLATPFFMLLLGILEIGVVFFGDSVLEKATGDAARLVRTGQAQAQNMTQQQFHDYICDQISDLLACGPLQVDVEAFSSFENVNIANPINGDGTLNTDLDNYNIGNRGDIVLVRTFYSWDIMTPLLRPFFSNLSNGDRLLTSTQAFRNEPF